MRTFAALLPDPPCQDTLLATQASWRAVDEQARWVPSEQLHLTLVFLGDVATTDLERVFEAASTAVSGLEPFPLLLGPCGRFVVPAREVLWRGVVEPTGRPLANLQQRLARALAPWSSAAPPFVPHLTLGYRRLRCQLGGVVPAAPPPPAPTGPWPVHQVHLMRSTFSQGRVVHSVLATLELVGDP